MSMCCSICKSTQHTTGDHRQANKDAKDCEHDWDPEMDHMDEHGFEIHKCRKCGEETIPEAM